MSLDIKYEIKSADGRVLKVYIDRVVLTQVGILGALSRGLAGEKTIYFCDVSSIQFKESGWTAGFMEFTFPGSNDRTGGPISGSKNENRFTFGKPTIGAARKLNIEVLKAKEYIEKRMFEIKNQRREAVEENSFSVADEIIKLKALLDSNAISTDEFEQLKQNLLSK